MKAEKLNAVSILSFALNVLLCLCLLVMGVHYQTFQHIYHKISGGGRDLYH